MQNKEFVIPGIAILVLFFLLPFWYNNTSALEDNLMPVLETTEEHGVPIDPATGEKVIGPCDSFTGSNETLEIWRARHSGFVSFYLDYEPKVAQCDNCHTPSKFCNVCHGYAGVKLSSAPRDDTSVLETFIPWFRTGEVAEEVHHHRWMEDILKSQNPEAPEDIKNRRCFSCHRDTHCAKCHPMNDPLKALVE